MVDAELYLDEVGRGLAVADFERRQILNELQQHIQDTAAGLEGDGLDRGIALRVALRRLGPARNLARDLTRANRAPGGLVAGARRRLRLVAGSVAMTMGALGWVLGMFGGTIGATPTHVDLLAATGTVDNVMASYIADGITRAHAEGASALIIQLNTPGGSLDATSKIVSSLLEAPLATIVWVAPQGGRAASAGTFITLAAHVALMAPGTNIGAASPIDSSGQDIPGTLGEKVKNDAIANIRSIAEARGRNVDWAVSTVAAAKSSPASEAVALKAVDGMAASIPEVIAFANGRQVTVRGAVQTLAVGDASVNELGMNVFQSFLHLLSDPNIAFILFTIGFYGLLYEVISPNFVTGIIGALALILAFIGSGSLPLNVAGVLLLGLAVLLLFLEATVASHGLLAIGGVICFALGAATFYTAPGPGLPNVQVAWPVVAFMGALGVVFALVVLRAALSARRLQLAPVSPGLGFSGTGTVGAIGEVRQTLDPEGSVYVVGEEWTARTTDPTPIPRGTAVRVVAQEGLVLVVERLAPDALSAAEASPTDAGAYARPTTAADAGVG